MQEDMNGRNEFEVNEGQTQDNSRRTSLIQSREMAYKQPLAALLRARKVERRLKMGELALLLGVSQPYLSQLLLGDKPFSSVSPECLRGIARFLNMPPLRVFFMAGSLLPSDLCVSIDEAAKQREMVMRLISESKFAQDASISFAELNELSESAQVLMMRMYQIVTRAELSLGKEDDPWKEFAETLRFAVRTVRPK